MKLCDFMASRLFSTVCLGYSEQLAERVAVKLIDTTMNIVHQIIRSLQYTALVKNMLIEAIKYLELKNIVHRDLKCENIFLDRYTHIKLVISALLGFSNFFEDLDTLAMEQIFGVLVSSFCHAQGKMPFDDRKPKEMIAQQMRHNAPIS
uniref:Protein kinase domain-containing protein n=1 Tax=Ditylenchus dipsaci TaxID=166011 RepID=A0A915D559_9BILA